MTALTLAESRCEHCTCPSERQQALTAAVVEAAGRAVDEYRTDLRSGRWSTALLEAMDDLRESIKTMRAAVARLEAP